MDVRSASIVIDDYMIASALTAHLTAAIMTQVATSDEFEAPDARIDVEVDDQPRDYTIMHVVTDRTYVSGMVLQHGVLDDDEEGVSNTLEYVLVRCGALEFEPVQQVYSMNEEEALDNKGRTMLKLLGKLYA